MANIIDIAKKTGLSASTVSRALSKPEKVATLTREKIMAAIEELGYETNIFARNLRQGGSRTIGLIVSDILNPFHATIVKAIQDEIYREAFTLMVGSSEEDAAKESSILSQLRSHQLQGLIIIPTTGSLENLSTITGIPVIEIDRFSGRINSDIVRLNNEEGMRLATEHLLSLGHTHFCYIGGSTEAETFKERIDGFLNACPEKTECLIFEIPGITALQTQAAEIARQVCARTESQRPTAIIAANNDIASGVVQGIYQSGLRLAEDVSLIAFDDPEWAEFFPCPITTVRQPVYEMGLFAAKQLLRRIRGELIEDATTWRFAPQLIIRSSTAPPMK